MSPIVYLNEARVVISDVFALFVKMRNGLILAHAYAIKIRRGRFFAIAIFLLKDISPLS